MEVRVILHTYHRGTHPAAARRSVDDYIPHRAFPVRASPGKVVQWQDGS